MNITLPITKDRAEFIQTKFSKDEIHIEIDEDPKYFNVTFKDVSNLTLLKLFHVGISYGFVKATEILNK
jgi:hypothetical protein